MTLAVHHLAVLVRDLARAEAFYAGVLGLTVSKRWSDAEGRPRSVWLRLGAGAFLALEKRAAEGPLRGEGAPGWHCVALGIAVEERETFRERLTKSGSPIERESAFTLYARDPDGNLIAFSHYPTPAPAR